MRIGGGGFVRRCLAMFADEQAWWVHLGGAMCDNIWVVINKSFSRRGAEVAG